LKGVCILISSSCAPEPYFPRGGIKALVQNDEFGSYDITPVVVPGGASAFVENGIDEDRIGETFLVYALHELKPAGISKVAVYVTEYATKRKKFAKTATSEERRRIRIHDAKTTLIRARGILSLHTNPPILFEVYEKIEPGIARYRLVGDVLEAVGGHLVGTYPTGSFIEVAA
jgi:hypothetical protein